MKKTRLGISSYSFPYAVGNQGIPDYMPEKRVDAFGLVDKAAALMRDIKIMNHAV